MTDSFVYYKSEADSYIGVRFIIGSLDEEKTNSIVVVDRVWQDDGGPDDFYLVVVDEKDGSFVDEVHVESYNDGYIIDQKYDGSHIIWIDKDNKIDEDYFELAHCINVNDMDECETDFYSKIITIHKETINA